MESFTITATLLLLVLVSVLGSVSAYKNYTVGDSLGWYDKLEKPNVDYQKWVVGKTFSLGDFLRSVSAYKNYTVGDSLGWYDKLEKPNVDYQKWVVGKTFSLGDFLIFNTDNNHSVVQTYNATTYKGCDYDDALEEDTTQWSSTDPSSTSPHPVSVPVPLLKVGLTYFFSGDYDGEQCQNGQNFEINVTYGQGLPPSLKKGPSGEERQAPAPVSPESAPDTLVPSNFDNPQNVSDDDATTSTTDDSSKAISLSAFSNFIGFLLIFFGLFFSII